MFQLVILALASAVLAVTQSQDAKLKALGKTLTDEVRWQSTPVGNAEVQDYVRQLGDRLASGCTFSVTFKTSGPRNVQKLNQSVPKRCSKLLPDDWVLAQID
jgi:hypothetical protein